VKNITRTIIGGICLGVVAVTGVPMLSLACRIKDYSPSTPATPFGVVLNEDQFNDTGEQINSEPTRKRSTFTDDVLMCIESRRDMIGGKIQERFQMDYGDRTADVKTWVGEWTEQNKTADRAASPH
jgi:hypothetical protein